MKILSYAVIYIFLPSLQRHEYSFLVQSFINNFIEHILALWYHFVSRLLLVLTIILCWY